MVITPRESDIYQKPNKLYMDSKRGNNSERESDIYWKPNTFHLESKRGNNSERVGYLQKPK